MSTKHMPDFKPIKLPVDEVSDEYKATIATFREWAGHMVYLGDALPASDTDGGWFILYKGLMDRLDDINMTINEMTGSKATYSAMIPGPGEPSPVWKGCMKMSMCFDERGDVWITGLSFDEPKAEYFPDVDSILSPRAQIERKKWTFHLTTTALTVTAAEFFDRHGIVHDVDKNALVDWLEAAPQRHGHGQAVATMCHPLQGACLGGHS